MMRVQILSTIAIIFAVDQLCTVAVAAPLSKPLLPIMFRVNTEQTGYPNYTSSELDLIADQSEVLTGSDGTLPVGDDLDRLRSRHPGYTVIPYLNAGHQGAWPDTGPQLEDDRLNYIQVYRATKLNTGINATTTKLPVDSITQIPVTGGAVNPRTAVHSLDGKTGANGGFISFVRVDNEIMRVTAKSSNPPTLTVIRGTDGTGPVGHDAGAHVLAPVYVDDYNPDGSLAIEDGRVRYSLNVGTTALANFLADNFVATYLRSGWDGAWLDITSPSFYNMVDALDADIDGETRFPYNTGSKEDYTISSRAYHHDLKVGRIQAEIEASFGYLPVLYANNNGDGKWFNDTGYGRRFAESNNAKIQGMDGVSLEAPFVKVADPPANWEPKTLPSWKKNARSVADATNRGYAVAPWLKMVGGSGYVPDNMYKPLGFSWASTLLAWGSNDGGSKVVLDMWTVNRRFSLPDFLYYNLGEPIGSGPATEDGLDALLIGSSTYKRDWTRGTVLVNPAETSDGGVSVSGYVDPSTCRPVEIESMSAYSYKILLLPDACN